MIAKSGLSAARVGTRWWADNIRKGFVPENGSEPSDATKSPPALVLTAMCKMKEISPVTSEMVDCFEAALARRIQAMLDSGRSLNVLSVDYRPDRELSAALWEAGIDPGMTILPWKTVMRVEPGSVGVSDCAGCLDLQLQNV